MTAPGISVATSTTIHPAPVARAKMVAVVPVAFTTASAVSVTVVVSVSSLPPFATLATRAVVPSRFSDTSHVVEGSTVTVAVAVVRTNHPSVSLVPGL